MLSIQDFETVALVETGNTGRNVVVRRATTPGRLYVAKVLWKWQLAESYSEDLRYLATERDIARMLLQRPHYLVQPLVAMFHSRDHIFKLTPYSPGHCMLALLQTHGSMEVALSRFYAAEVCAGLAYLHSQGILYRNLELAHVMLQPSGHIQLINFSISKPGMSYSTRTRSFRLGPGSMAPEVLMDFPYGFSVDWWAFGQILYTMLLSRTAFNGDDEDEIYDSILHPDPLWFPSDFDRSAQMLIKELLEQEPDIRLGSGRTDAEEVMSHIFFRDVTWDNISQLALVPPSVPSPPQHAIDEAHESVQIPIPSAGPQQILSADQQALFRDFDFAADGSI